MKCLMAMAIGVVFTFFIIGVYIHLTPYLTESVTTDLS